MTDKRTALYQEHLNLGARMVPFGGWSMPIQYEGIIAETEQCRTRAVLFDTCHMGEFYFKGDLAASGIERPISFPIDKVPVGKCKYGFLLDDKGCVIDDLIIYRLAEDELMFVVNAGTCENDYSVIKSYLSGDFVFDNISDNKVKLDLQGPLAKEVMTKIFDGPFDTLSYFGFFQTDYKGQQILISRTGYTGELGYEIYADTALGVDLWRTLLADERVKPAGLGARDVLRLEVGMSLYGNDIDAQTTPVEAGLSFFVDFNKDFVGKDVLVQQKAEGTSRKKIAFTAASRRSPRHDLDIYSGDRKIGVVTSGVFSPMLKCGIGLGYVEPEFSKIGTAIQIKSGKNMIDAEVSKLPFYTEGTARKK